MPQFDRLDGIGRIRVYDNRGRTVDRYTVLFEDMPDPMKDVETPVRPYGPREALSMSGRPTHPQGVSQWTDAHPGPWLGRRIPFASLPENVQQHVIYRAKENGAMIDWPTYNDLRATANDESLSYGEIAQIEAAFALVPDTQLRDLRENATADDMLDEIAAFLAHGHEVFVTDEGIVPTCDLCSEAQRAEGDDWNGETGNHHSCEERDALLNRS